MAAKNRWSTGSTRWVVGLGASFFAAAFLAASVSAATQPIGIVTGQDAGWPDVRGWNRLGEQALQIAPWGYNPIAFSPYSTYQYGVRIAVGDVNGDGKAEIVTAPGKGAWTELRVFDGTSFKPIKTLLPFTDGAWWNGAFVATGDTTGAGRDEVIDGLDAGCRTTIHVVDATTGSGGRRRFLPRRKQRPDRYAGRGRGPEQRREGRHSRGAARKQPCRGIRRGRRRAFPHVPDVRGRGSGRRNDRRGERYGRLAAR